MSAGKYGHIPKELFVHITRDDISIDNLINDLYDNPTQDTISYFKTVNSHLKDKVRPGQFVMLLPKSKQTDHVGLEKVQALAVQIDNKQQKLSKTERHILAKNYDLLSNIADISGSGVGVGMNYFTQNKRYVEQVLREIEIAHVRSFNKYGNLHNGAFFRQRSDLFLKLKLALKRMPGHSKMGLDFNEDAIKRSLGLSTKRITRQWKHLAGPAESIEGFNENFDSVMRYSHWLRAGGYVGVALDIGESAIKIHEACTLGSKNQCRKTEFNQVGRASGSIIGGGAGGALATYLTCNALFGLESGGTSLLWCGIVAGGVGGYFGSKFGGKYIKKTGNLLYDEYYR